MNQDQLKIMQSGQGFIAALDQSGGSTPKALKAYGVSEDEFDSEEHMFDLVHEMRVRIMTSPSFTSDEIIGTILFKETMERQVDDMDTADYLWEKKGIVPILKVDAGLADEENGVQLMKPIPDFDALLERGVEKHIFATKMRSVINENNTDGIKANVEQQFEFAKQIIGHGLVPIIEPEVNIHAEDKAAIEDELLVQLTAGLDALSADQKVMFKLTLPETANHYAELLEHPNLLRLVALSGGYSRDEANDRLSKNHGVTASFSRALTNDLSAGQTQEEFDAQLKESIKSIYQASIT